MWLDYEVIYFLMILKICLLEEVIRDNSTKSGRKAPVVFISQDRRIFWFFFPHILLNYRLTAPEAAELKVIIR